MKKRIITLLVLLFVISIPMWAAGISSTDIVKYQGRIFDLVYLKFSNLLNLSFKTLKNNIIPSLLLALITLELMWVAIQAILQKTMSLSEILIKFFLVCLVVVITQNLDLIVKGLMRIFTQIAKASGSSADLYEGSALFSGEYTLFSPSNVINSTTSMLSPLQTAEQRIFEYINELQPSLFNIAGFLSAIIPAYIGIFTCWVVEMILLVMISFVNINVTMWLIEFQFLLVVCTICLPWQIFSPTKFVASGIWQALFGQAIKLFCIVFLVATCPKLFRDVSSETVNKLLEALNLSASSAEVTSISWTALGSLIVTTVALTLTYCYFLMKGPAIAKAIIVGQPTMETLGSHTVTRMGAQAMGVAGAGLGAAGGVFGHAIGSIIGSIGGFRRDSSKAEKDSGSNGSVNEAKW